MNVGCAFWEGWYVFVFSSEVGEENKWRIKRGVESIVHRDGQSALCRASGDVQGVCSTEYNTDRIVLDCCSDALQSF